MNRLENKIVVVTGGSRGVGIPYQCDHRNDEEVRKLFKKIKKEYGNLDILFNNVWGGYENIYQVTNPEDYIFEDNFWEQPISLWDDMWDSISLIISRYG